MYSVSVNNYDDWRKQARELLKRNISPDTISWQQDNQGSLFSEDQVDSFLSVKIQCHQPTIPKDFFDLAEKVACYRDDSRWSILYSVAWRLVFEDRGLLAYKIDPQIARLNNMRKSVSRDKHKMDVTADANPRLIAAEYTCNM